MLIWFAIGTALLLLELVTPTFILMFFGFGAWGAALMAYLYPGTPQELITFIIVAALSLFLFRSRMKNIFQGLQASSHKNPSIENFPYIGKEARVHKDISPQKEGEVFVGGSYWRATSAKPIAKDTIVLIQKQDADDNQLLIVTVQS